MKLAESCHARAEASAPAEDEIAYCTAAEVSPSSGVAGLAWAATVTELEEASKPSPSHAMELGAFATTRSTGSVVTETASPFASFAETTQYTV